jgi:hypothetical protein
VSGSRASGPRRSRISADEREEFVGYFKVIVYLACFALTVSVALVGLLLDPGRQRALLLTGWVLLGVCVLLNLLALRRLLTLPADERGDGPLRSVQWLVPPLSRDEMRKYGCLQSLVFTVGCACIGVALLLDPGDRSRQPADAPPQASLPEH